MITLLRLFYYCILFQDQCCVLNSIVGWDSTIGKWARVEGTPSDPNPNDPFAKIDSETLFRDGKLTPSITILGKPHWMSLFGTLCVLPKSDTNEVEGSTS